MKLCFLISLALCEITDKSMERPRMSQFFLPETDQYIDWWKITDVNLESRVLESVDAWIVVLCPENQIPFGWKEYSLKYRGQIWFGKFLDKHGENLKERYSYEGKPKILVYKWTRDAKTNGPFITDDFSVAIETAVESLPVKHLVNLSFETPKEDPTNIDNFLIRAFYGVETKPKYPIVFVYDDYGETKGIPALMRIISHYFHDYFLFGLVKLEDKFSEFSKKFTSYKLSNEHKELPEVLLLLGKEPKDEEVDQGDMELSFSIVKMTPIKFGSSSRFTDVVGYLFWLNNELRELLPGRSADESMDDQTLASIRNKLWRRLEIIKPSIMKGRDNTDMFNDVRKKYQKLQKAAHEQFEQLKEEQLKKKLDNNMEEPSKGSPPAGGVLPEDREKFERLEAKDRSQQEKQADGETKTSDDPKETGQTSKDEL